MSPGAQRGKTITCTLKCLIFKDLYLCVIFQNRNKKCTGWHTVLDVVVFWQWPLGGRHKTQKAKLYDRSPHVSQKKMSDLIRKGLNVCTPNQLDKPIYLTCARKLEKWMNIPKFLTISVLVSVAGEPALCLTGFQARLSRLHGNQEASQAGLQGSGSQGFSDRLGRQSQDSHEWVDFLIESFLTHKHHIFSSIDCYHSAFSLHFL